MTVSEAGQGSDPKSIRSNDESQALDVQRAAAVNLVLGSPARQSICVEAHGASVDDTNARSGAGSANWSLQALPRRRTGVRHDQESRPKTASCDELVLVWTGENGNGCTGFTWVKRHMQAGGSGVSAGCVRPTVARTQRSAIRLATARGWLLKLMWIGSAMSACIMIESSQTICWRGGYRGRGPAT